MYISTFLHHTDIIWIVRMEAYADNCLFNVYSCFFVWFGFIVYNFLFIVERFLLFKHMLFYALVWRSNTKFSVIEININIFIERERRFPRYIIFKSLLAFIGFLFVVMYLRRRRQLHSIFKYSREEIPNRY